MLPVKLWFPLVLRNKNKTAEIKLFKSLYKRTPQNCGVLFLCRNASAWRCQMEHIASIALRRGIYREQIHFTFIIPENKTIINAKQSPSHVF